MASIRKLGSLGSSSAYRTIKLTASMISCPGTSSRSNATAVRPDAYKRSPSVLSPACPCQFLVPGHQASCPAPATIPNNWSSELPLTLTTGENSNGTFGEITSGDYTIAQALNCTFEEAEPYVDARWQCLKPKPHLTDEERATIKAEFEVRFRKMASNPPS